jgi:anti-sigma-K factor RskA
MTKRHDPGNDSDEAFEAFLRGEDALSAELQGIEQPAPSPELDARIRAQAREALEQPAGAANDAEEKALVSSPLGRWRAPLALAATVVIGVTLG